MRLGPYEILTPLGAGGMGEVYRARDTKLRREVAIKVLPEALARDPDALARFEREALAVAALSHPNILSIFDFGSHDGVAYAVTELLEGQTLREALKSGAVPLRTALLWARETAEGLASAHERGVVHRDLKPENLFVTRDGHVKILDFGLARQVRLPSEEASSAQTESQGTDPGTVMGTVGYMSPEQVRGQRGDHRSDIFSFGTVLYEILSGKKAFKRDSAVDSMAAILMQEPAELAESGRAVPPALEGIVRRCLGKKPEERYQSAREIVLALEELSVVPTAPPSGTGSRLSPGRRRWLVAAAGLAMVVAVSAAVVLRGRGGSGVSAGARKAKRIAVLPFENLGSAEDAVFASGLTEELISRLATLQGVAVISRTTAVGYDRKGKSIRQIGADLGVEFVLEGTVRSDRGPGQERRVRINPQLVQVSDDTHVWAERYDRVLSDIFAIQTEVSERVVQAMGVKLLPREERALKAASTTDMEAYELYLRAREVSNRGQTRQVFEEAIALYQAAVDRDPRFAQALAQLVKSHLYLYFTEDQDPARAEKASKAIRLLETLGADLAETHLARGYHAYWVELDFPRALDEFQKVLLLQPSSSDVLEARAYVLRRMDRWPEAADEFSRWLELDPRNPLALFQYGLTCRQIGRFEEADRGYRLSSALNPRFAIPWAGRATVQIRWKGDLEKALSLISEARKVPGLQDGTGELAFFEFRVHTMRRDPTAALKGLDAEKRALLLSQHHVLPIDLLRGEAYALAGDRERSRAAYAVARRLLEAEIGKRPRDESKYQSALGIASAGLGLVDEALRAASRGTELMPPSKDSFRALVRVDQRAQVETMVGRFDDAIDHLDWLASQQATSLSANELRLDPRWDPLRSHPRYGALKAKLEARK